MAEAAVAAAATEPAAPTPEAATPAEPDKPAESKAKPEIIRRRPSVAEKRERAVAKLNGSKAKPDTDAAEDDEDDEKPAAKEDDKPETDKPKPPPPQERLDKAFAALKHERGKLQTRRVELDQREAKLTEREQAIAELESLGKRDQYALAQRLGLNLDTLARQALQSEEPAEQKRLRELEEKLSRVDKLEAELKAKQEREAGDRAYQSGLNQMEQFFEANAAEFPTLSLLKSEGYVRQAWDKMLAHYHQTGEILDRYDVLLQTEEQLAAFASKLSPRGASERGNGAGKSPAKPETTEASAVTHAASAERAPGGRKLTHQERVEQAKRRLERA